MAVLNQSVTVYENYSGSVEWFNRLDRPPNTEMPDEAAQSGGASGGFRVGRTLTFNAFSTEQTTITDLGGEAEDPTGDFFDELEVDTAFETSVFGQPAGTTFNGAYEVLLTDPNTGLTYIMVTFSFGSNNDEGGYDGVDGWMFFGPNGEPPTGVALEITDITRFVQEPWSEVYAVCFVRGTMISTGNGSKPIERLQVGDCVELSDGRLKEILWIGSRVLSHEDLKAKPELRPVRIEAGALGGELPDRDLAVSPQHRIHIRSVIAERMCGRREVLIPAKHLVGTQGIEIAKDFQSVEYWHFLLDEHSVVLSNGIGSESLFPGPEALKSISDAAREEIFSIFPELRTTAAAIEGLALPTISGRKAKKLVLRATKNNKALLEDVE